MADLKPKDIVAIRVRRASDAAQDFPDAHNGVVEIFLADHAADRLGLPRVRFALDGAPVSSRQAAALGRCTDVASVDDARTVRRGWGARRTVPAAVHLRRVPCRTLAEPLR